MRIAGTALEEEFLPDDFMRQWTQNFTTILSFIKVCSLIEMMACSLSAITQA